MFDGISSITTCIYDTRRTFIEKSDWFEMPKAWIFDKIDHANNFEWIRGIYFIPVLGYGYNNI